MSTRPETTRKDEAASALTLAIVVMVLGMVVTVAMMTMLDWSGQRGKSRSDRAQNVAVIDRAIAAYEYALESNLTNDYHLFQLNAQAMTRLASSDAGMALGEARVIPNATFGADFRKHGLDRTWMRSAAYAQSMQHTLPDGRTSWWQLVNTIAPGASSPTLIAYVRTWIAAGDASSRVITEPRIARVELRPGRFSDFQLLVDGPLVIGNGTTIRGRIHSNGYPDAYLVDAFTRPGYPIKINGTPTCDKGAALSTAAGLVEMNPPSQPCASFPKDENNGRRIDLLRGQAHLEMLRSLCGPIVFCPSGAGPWNINLSSQRVNGQPIPAGAKAVYVRGEASLAGTTTRQLTIGVAEPANSYGSFGSAALSLRGNGAIGAANTASAAGGTVGLVVAGDIVPRFDQGSCPSALNAAVVSTSGSLTMPAQYRVPAQPMPTSNTCPKMVVTGSLGTHYAPLMYLAWGSVEAGYRLREYNYDVRLRNNPPPLFPLTGPWQVSSWKNATSECLSTANRARADCG